MRIRIAVAVEIDAPAHRLRSPSALGGIARAGVEQALADVGLTPSDVKAEVAHLPELVAGVCDHCGGPVPAPRRPGGRRRRFCSDAHRVAAQRRRAQGLPERLPRPAAARGRRSLARAAELVAEGWGIGDRVLVADPYTGPKPALVMAENAARPTVVKVKYEHSRTAAWVARGRITGRAPQGPE